MKRYRLERHYSPDTSNTVRMRGEYVSFASARSRVCMTDVAVAHYEETEL